MGVYDFVLFEPDVLPSADLEESAHKVSWQTRAFRDPMYRLHYVSEDGLMYRADHNYESNGFAESYGETGSFDFLDNLLEDDYKGYPSQYSNFDWFRVRFVGNLRVTAQTESKRTVRYDIEFDRHSINQIHRVQEEELDREIRSRIGNLETDDIRVGERVYDKKENSYEIVEVIDKRADEFVLKSTDRDHVVYEERTVADLNEEFPNDDKIVKVRSNRQHGGIRYFPISRIALDPRHIIK